MSCVEMSAGAGAAAFALRGAERRLAFFAAGFAAALRAGAFAVFAFFVFLGLRAGAALRAAFTTFFFFALTPFFFAGDFFFALRAMMVSSNAIRRLLALHESGKPHRARYFVFSDSSVARIAFTSLVRVSSIAACLRSRETSSSS